MAGAQQLTHPEVIMDNAQKRIAIAMTDGWRKVHLPERKLWLWLNEISFRITDVFDDGVESAQGLPDYFFKPKLMFRLESGLTDQQFLRYEGILTKLVQEVDSTRVISAAAWQRAEAYGLTLNLWAASH